MQASALLAIRSDVAPAIEAEYLDWLTKEHTLERVGIEGFVSARILRSQRQDVRRYFILYELESETVVNSPAYLERLNNPTQWSARMMPHLGNFIRGGGKFIFDYGMGYGSVILPLSVPFARPLDSERLAAIARAPQVTAVRCLHTNEARTSVSTHERSMRAGDKSFERVVLIEGVDNSGLLQAISTHYPELAHLNEDEEVDRNFCLLIFFLTKSALTAPGC